MKKNFISYISGLLVVLTIMSSCKKEIGSLNGSTIEELSSNATKFQLNNVVTGTESGMRNSLDFYLDAVGMIGREMYRFAGSEPRYTTDLLGGGSATLNNNTFYLTNSWNSRYRVVKNCNILIQATNNSSLVKPEEKKGYLGFAKTIKAYELLLNLNLTQNNGIRIEVANPDSLGPVVLYPEALTTIAGLLDEAKTDLTGSVFAFKTTLGFNEPAGFIKFNRALAARVAVYRQQWAAALTALNESFFNLNGPFNAGADHIYSTGPNDQLNLTFFPQNQNGEIRLAHPSYSIDITPGDDRIAKATLRTSAASLDNLTSNRDVWVYTSSTASMPIIRNEELILIYAEAKINLTQFPDGIVALNRIRTGHNLPPYAGGITLAALTTEMLNQRRFSLFFEGHRWVDMRRYNRLNQLPLDRAGDDVWEKFPLPLTEM
ncbi:RagB/SusD family nutrient uptake outer membrane protein [Paraflavitalea sp. CAU 1676]|uniref:RagB/SusD family nutrient uptake outer membrane protein n=1 Tax=Paraflavitalea sp. CAU 1676 TaxID=3032598 RepID=UPI0023DBD048|nr:RagB/SusD family nutrient uptake outer membrane protein [Paraflavitalea sp. CAU 1676]MDF2187416.1 RagB/SusD family nutrient uptake outer membrane protein [Paraflavitalea sp. CAU 1676]